MIQLKIMHDGGPDGLSVTLPAENLTVVQHAVQALLQGAMEKGWLGKFPSDARIYVDLDVDYPSGKTE